MKQKQEGFTLIELLVAAAIIGLLSSIILVSLNAAREKARDATRLHNINQIQKALSVYYNDNGRYPNISADGCCTGWDQGPCGADPFIGALETAGLLSEVPKDPSGGTGTGCYGYNYYRYNAGDNGCDISKGAYYVLGIRDMESSEGTHSKSPGWSCSGRNWETGDGFEWVTGSFEN